jgi:hypothetical protein
MKNVLTARVTKEQHVNAYLQLWNGGLKLTDRELKVVKEIVKSYMEFEQGGVKEPYLSQMVLSTENANRIKKELKLSKQNFSNIKTKLKDKKVLLTDQEDRTYVNPTFIPKKSITFNFDVI